MLMLVFLFLFTLPYQGAEGANVALGKRITCNEKYVGKGATDGDYNIQTPIVLRMACLALVINLVEEYYLHYVVVYDGIKPSDLGRNIKNWDFYAVSMQTNVTSLHVCSIFMEKAPSPFYNRGHRVNCMGWDKTFSLVHLTSTYSYGYSIAEINVHSIGTGVPRTGALIYRGCFIKVENRVVKDGHSVETCGFVCGTFGFIALREKKCYCGRKFDFVNEIETKRCYYKCPTEPTKYCGGRIGYSLYLSHLQLPFYYGCFAKNLSCSSFRCIQDFNMTIQRCINFCNTTKYANIKGYICLCDNEDATNEESHLACNISCAGQPSDRCGGTGTIVKYGTCQTDWNWMSCNSMMRCAGYLDKFANCKGRCLQGFKGEHCLEKDLQGILFDYEYKETTTPTTTRPTTTETPTSPTGLITFTTPTTPTPTTTPTTEKETSTPTTMKIYEDSCIVSKPCEHDNKTTCISLPKGEYKCQCISGYAKKDSNSKCEDVDECSFSDPPCDPETTMCKNYPGFYECDCKEGFLKEDYDICTKNVSAVVGGEYDADSYAMMIFYGSCLALILILLGIYYYDTSIDVDNSE